MKVSTDTAAEVLKSFIQEDRTEVRLIRERIQSITSSIVLASFAITAFFVADFQPTKPINIGNYAFAIDALLFVVIFVHFWRLKLDLIKLRQALKARQDLLVSLDLAKVDIDINPFPDPKNVIPDIHDRDLYWFVSLSACIVVIKAVIGYAIIFS